MIAPTAKIVAGLVAAAVAVPAVTAAASTTAPPAPAPATHAAAPHTPVPTVAATRTALTAKIDARLSRLRSWAARVSGDSRVGTADRATLAALFAEQEKGLTGLRATVAAATTLPALRADAATMYNTYRVFLVTGPKAHLVVRADRISARAAGFAQARARLSAELAGITDPTLRAQLQALLADATNQLAAATATARAAATGALALSPAHAGTAKAAEGALRTSLETAQHDVLAARGDISKIHSALSAAHVTTRPAPAGLAR